MPGFEGGLRRKTPARWLLQTGDADFYHRGMDKQPPWCTPGLRFYQTMMEKDRNPPLANQARLRSLTHTHGGEVEVVCSHDPLEFECLAGHSLRAPLKTRASPRLDVAPRHGWEQAEQSARVRVRHEKSVRRNIAVRNDVYLN